MYYFTISEFGKLRNVNINSLRYYEKIGILKPHHVDEQTGYRYYSPDQLPILDVILLCLNFGMPLKELRAYISDDKFINNSELFAIGKQIAQKRLHNARMELEKIEYTQRYLQSNQQYSKVEGAYQRAIPDRTLVAMAYHGELTDIRKIELTSAQLYSYAQEQQLYPVFPAGLLIQNAQGELQTKVFFEVMDKDTADPFALKVPAGTFLCHKIDMTPGMDLLTTIDSAYGGEPYAEVMAANILLDKFQIGTKKSELQKRIPEGPPLIRGAGETIG